MEVRPFEITEAREDGRLVLALSGEIDMATAPRIRAALERAAGSPVPEIRVDLRDVGFMDSTGLSALVRAHLALDGEGRRLTIVCPTTAGARRAIEVSGLLDLLVVYDDGAG